MFDTPDLGEHIWEIKKQKNVTNEGKERKKRGKKIRKQKEEKENEIQHSEASSWKGKPLSKEREKS